MRARGTAFSWRAVANTIKMWVCYNGGMTRVLYYLQFLLLAGLWWLYRLMPVR